MSPSNGSHSEDYDDFADSTHQHKFWPLPTDSSASKSLSIDEDNAEDKHELSQEALEQHQYKQKNDGKEQQEEEDEDEDEEAGDNVPADHGDDEKSRADSQQGEHGSLDGSSVSSWRNITLRFFGKSVASDSSLTSGSVGPPLPPPSLASIASANSLHRLQHRLSSLDVTAESDHQHNAHPIQEVLSPSPTSSPTQANQGKRKTGSSRSFSHRLLNRLLDTSSTEASDAEDRKPAAIQGDLARERQEHRSMMAYYELPGDTSDGSHSTMSNSYTKNESFFVDSNHQRRIAEPTPPASVASLPRKIQRRMSMESVLSIGVDSHMEEAGVAETTVPDNKEDSRKSMRGISPSSSTVNSPEMEPPLKVPVPIPPLPPPPETPQYRQLPQRVIRAAKSESSNQEQHRQEENDPPQVNRARDTPARSGGSPLTLAHYSHYNRSNVVIPPYSASRMASHHAGQHPHHLQDNRMNPSPRVIPPPSHHFHQLQQQLQPLARQRDQAQQHHQQQHQQQQQQQQQQHQQQHQHQQQKQHHQQQQQRDSKNRGPTSAWMTSYPHYPQQEQHEESERQQRPSSGRRLTEDGQPLSTPRMLNNVIPIRTPSSSTGSVDADDQTPINRRNRSLGRHRQHSSGSRMTSQRSSSYRTSSYRTSSYRESSYRTSSYRTRPRAQPDGLDNRDEIYENSIRGAFSFYECKGGPYVWALRILGGLVGLMLLAIGIYFVVTSQTTSDRSPSMGTPPTRQPTPSPTADLFPSFDDYVNILSPAISSREDLTDSNTPQYAALYFIMNIDQSGIYTTLDSIRQRYALLTTYFAMDPTFSSRLVDEQVLNATSLPHESWLDPTSHECKWGPFVMCESSYGLETIVALDLSGTGLNGTIPSEISQLSQLEILRLSENHLQGTIPSEIRSLAKLELLDLDTNFLVSTIPTELLNLTSLRMVDLSFNSFSGPFHDGFELLPFLEFLGLRDNGLTGTLPETIGHAKELVYLYVDNNFFTGRIPKNYLSMPNQEEFTASNNMLTGTLPNDTVAEIMSAPQASRSNNDKVGLTKFDVSNNMLTGTIPSYLSTPSLLFVELAHNMLSGSVDALVQSDASHLGLSNNKFNGSFPALFGADLTSVDLSGNNFLGEISPQIATLVHLEYLDVGRNTQINGTLPVELGSIGTLTHLGISSCAIEGKIPGEFGSLGRLKTIDLGGNWLEGNIPDEFVGLTSLKYLGLNSANISGSIPAFLGELSQLERILLNNNRLNGTIPDSFTLLSNLVEVRLENNNLTGSVPDGVCSLAPSSDDGLPQLMAFSVDCEVNCTCCEYESEEGCGDVVSSSEQN